MSGYILVRYKEESFIIVFNFSLKEYPTFTATKCDGGSPNNYKIKILNKPLVTNFEASVTFQIEDLKSK